MTHQPTRSNGAHSRARRRIVVLVRYCVVAAVIVPIIGLCVTEIKTAPATAIVFVDQKSRSYLSPPCLRNPEAMALEPSTIIEAQAQNLTPDDGCRNGTGFTQDGRSLTGKLLERWGLLPPLPSRWNDDGTWNW